MSPDDRTLRILIADDEAPARLRLGHLLQPMDVEVVAEAANGPEALTAIADHAPDLVLLDIEMPGLSGLEVARRASDARIVFTTAFAEHAVAAFELQALDYLLKPVRKDGLERALQRVRLAIGDRPDTGSEIADSVSTAERLEDALSAEPLRRIFVRQHGTLIPIPTERVVRLQADGDYVSLHTTDGGTHYLQATLQGIERRLNPDRFARVHRSHIVNLDQVKAFRPLDSSRLEAEMTDGSRVTVSRNRSRWLRTLGM